MLSAGQRTHRVRFEARLTTNPDAPDDLGNVESSFVPIVEVWAGFLPRFGREQLKAGTLESGLTGTLTVLRFAATSSVTESSRVVFLTGPHRGTVCNIRSIVPTPREIEFLVASGVAT
jgi:head-tail adaptor